MVKRKKSTRKIRTKSIKKKGRGRGRKRKKSDTNYSGGYY